MSSSDPTTDPVAVERPWQDASRSPEERVAALIGAMTLREKTAQLYGVWVGANPDGPAVAPHQTELEKGLDLEALLEHGLGQITRAFGTNPVDPAQGAAALARLQRHIVEANRFGVPALVHEECLAGFTTWKATAYPVPLSWGATFDPELVGEMAARIGAGMRSVGVHQGLAPVLDVVRDARWGRVEETIGEDPYLIGTVATAYVRGLQSAGIVATLKHFAGYSASRAGRNLAPVSMGARELADVVLPPFEMAVVEGGAQSVMHSYAEVDGIPAAANRQLLTELLRETWGFTGTVVADYFGIGFLMLLHGVAADFGEAAAQALLAGVDVELPGPKAFLEPLIEQIESGRLDESVVDTALERVLRQKLELGLLEKDWDARPAALQEADLVQGAEIRGTVDLDPAADRAIARRIADEAVVLLKNDGLLPLDAQDGPKRIAVIGPAADDPFTMLGCYSFPSHVGTHHPELPLGVEIATIRAALRDGFPHAAHDYAQGVAVDGDDVSGIPGAVAAAAAADVVVLALGDRAGLFGNGTSGEGCDAPDLALPGRQGALLEAVLDTGVPTVLVVDSGRPYALGTAPERAAAIVQTFFPGEEGGRAIADVLAGEVEPSGHLPVSVPASPGGQPWTYLSQILANRSEVSNLDPTPAYAFGTGLTYTTFAYSDLEVVGGTADAAAQVPVDGTARLSFTVTNTGERSGTEIVQLYLHDPVAQVTRPVVKLVGFARVQLAAGASARVTVDVPADTTSFVGRDLTRVVEPGAIELRIGASSADVRLTAHLELVGDAREVGIHRERHCTVQVAPLGA